MDGRVDILATPAQAKWGAQAVCLCFPICGTPLYFLQVATRSRHSIDQAQVKLGQTVLKIPL